jgi:long-subunit acyl-CoA synthetase (AMP-forming)
MLDDYDLSTVRGGTSGGAPLGAAIIEGVYKRLGFMIRMGYGLSEAASVSTTVAANWEELEPFLEYTGKPCPGIELKVISVEGDGKSVSFL